jgi:hypothetical protein
LLQSKQKGFSLQSLPQYKYTLRYSPMPLLVLFSNKGDTENAKILPFSYLKSISGNGKVFKSD